MFFSLHSMTCNISSLGVYVRRGFCPTENRRGFCPGGILSRGAFVLHSEPTYHHHFSLIILLFLLVNVLFIFLFLVLVFVSFCCTSTLLLLITVYKLYFAETFCAERYFVRWRYCCL